MRPAFLMWSVTRPESELKKSTRRAYSTTEIRDEFDTRLEQLPLVPSITPTLIDNNSPTLPIVIIIDIIVIPVIAWIQRAEN